MLKKLKKISILVILIIVASCSKNFTPISNGCKDFCEVLPEPTKLMFEKNIYNDTFDVLKELHSIKNCGCIADETEQALCFQKYN